MQLRGFSYTVPIVAIVSTLLSLSLLPNGSAFRPRHYIGIDHHATRRATLDLKGGKVPFSSAAVDYAETIELKTDHCSLALEVRGGSTAADVFMSPALYIMVLITILRVYGKGVRFSGTIENILMFFLVGYFFHLLTKWQKNVEEKSEADVK